MTRRWTLRVAACLVAGTAVLAGCSEKQEASSSLPTPSSAEPTQEELPPLGPAEFPVPADAREKTPKGALAFARYYMAIGGEIGMGRAPASALLDLSTSECRLCGQIARSFADDQAAGYTYRGSSNTFQELGPPRLRGDQAELGFVFSQSGYTVVDAAGQEVPERAGQPSGDLQSGMLLTWSQASSSWLVSNLTVG